jgi:hypothetical protein
VVGVRKEYRFEGPDGEASLLDSSRGVASSSSTASFSIRACR